MGVGQRVTYRTTKKGWLPNTTGWRDVVEPARQLPGTRYTGPRPNVILDSPMISWRDYISKPKGRIVGLSETGWRFVGGIAGIGTALTVYEIATVIGEFYDVGPWGVATTGESIDPDSLTVGDTVGEWTLALKLNKQYSTYDLEPNGYTVLDFDASAVSLDYRNHSTEAQAKARVDLLAGLVSPISASTEIARIGYQVWNKVLPSDVVIGWATAAELCFTRPGGGTETAVNLSTETQTLVQVHQIPETTPRGVYTTHTQTSPVKWPPIYTDINVVTGKPSRPGRDGGRKLVGRGSAVLATVSHALGEVLEWIEVLARGFGWTGKRHHRFMFAQGNPGRTRSMIAYLQRDDISWDWDRFLDALNQKVLEDKIGRRVFNQVVRDLNALGVDISSKFTGLL